jgi:PilZ domain
MPRPIYPKSLLRGGSVRFDTGRNNYPGRDIEQCILRPPRYSHTMEHERRRAPRYPLIASVEVIEPQMNTHLRARTSDLSLVGCYLDITNTLPEGTEVRLHIFHEDANFTAFGVVIHSLPTEHGHGRQIHRRPVGPARDTGEVACSACAD